MVVDDVVPVPVGEKNVAEPGDMEDNSGDADEHGDTAAYVEEPFVMELDQVLLDLGLTCVQLSLTSSQNIDIISSAWLTDHLQTPIPNYASRHSVDQAEHFAWKNRISL